MLPWQKSNTKWSRSWQMCIRDSTKPFNEISGVVTELQNALACAARVFELLDADDQIPEAENAAALQPDGHVVLHDVSFRYLPDRPLIEGLNLDVKPGQRIAIVGPTGCGKTTLINLLMRFYDVNGGSITVSGTDIRDVKMCIRDSFGPVISGSGLHALELAIVQGGVKAALSQQLVVIALLHDCLLYTSSWGTNLPRNEDRVTPGEKNTPQKPNLSCNRSQKMIRYCYIVAVI